MIIRNTNKSPCSITRTDDTFLGQCCCNCKHRYIVIARNFPIGYICKLKFNDSPETIMTHMSNNAHAFCECYESVE